MSSPTSAPEVQGCHGPALALRTGTGGREGRRCPLSAAEPESGPSGSGHTRSSCTRLRRARRSTVASDPGGCGWSLSPGLRSSAETSPGDPRSSPAVRATDRGQGRARPRGAAEACRALAAAPRSPAPGSADLFLLPWKLPRQAQPAARTLPGGRGGPCPNGRCSLSKLGAAFAVGPPWQGFQTAARPRGCAAANPAASPHPAPPRGPISPGAGTPGGPRARLHRAVPHGWRGPTGNIPGNSQREARARGLTLPLRDRGRPCVPAAWELGAERSRPLCCVRKMWPRRPGRGAGGLVASGRMRPGSRGGD